MTRATIGSFASSTRRIAYGGALIFGMAATALGLSVQAPGAHAASAITVSVPSKSAPFAGFGGGPGVLGPTPVTGLTVTATTAAIVISADSSTININTSPPMYQLAANGQVGSSGIGSYPYTDPTPQGTARPGAHLGALLYRIGGGAIHAVPFAHNSLSAMAIPTGGETGQLYLLVNDNYYADNTGSFTVTAQEVQVPTISKAYSTTPATSPVSVFGGQPTTLTFTISNPNPVSLGTNGSLAGISFTDSLVGNASGVQSINASNPATTCGGSLGFLNNNSAIASLALTGATLAAGASCTAIATIVYTLAPTAVLQTLTNTTSNQAYTQVGPVAVTGGTFAPATAQLILMPAPDHLVILCGNLQVTPATAQYALPLVVQVRDAANNPVPAPIGLQFTINPALSNGAGASFTPVGTSAPFNPATLTTTVTTGSIALPAGCPGAPASQQGIAVVQPYANQTPSLPTTVVPFLEQYTIAAAVPAFPLAHAATFSEANSQQVARSCSLRIGFFSSLGSTNGTTSTQFSLATGKLAGGAPTLINNLALRGSGGQLRALPTTASVTCLLPYAPPAFPTVRLPLQVDFNAAVSSSTVTGITAPSTIHVTIKLDLVAGPAVESVTITNLAGTTTYYAFTPTNTSVAPRTFAISALP